MFVCKECGHVFEEPEYWVEKHGFDYPPYEEWSGCPNCRGDYVETHICDGCSDYINGPYIKTVDGTRYCENCYTAMELEDEE